MSIIAFYVLQAPFYGVSPASVEPFFQLYSGAMPGGIDAAVTALADHDPRSASDNPRRASNPEEERGLIDAKIRAHIRSFKVSADIVNSGCTCVAGRNGAGKTSLMKALAGFIRLDEGHLSVGGVEVGMLPVKREASCW